MDSRELRQRKRRKRKERKLGFTQRKQRKRQEGIERKVKRKELVATSKRQRTGVRYSKETREARGEVNIVLHDSNALGLPVSHCSEATGALGNIGLLKELLAKEHNFLTIGCFLCWWTVNGTSDTVDEPTLRSLNSWQAAGHKLAALKSSSSAFPFREGELFELVQC